MSIPVTGHIAQANTGHELVIERTFRASIEDVWKSIVEPERMNRWIGTWSGDAGPGKRISFTMTFEDGAEPEEVLIHRCDAPRHLDVESYVGDSIWRMRVDLSEQNGVTTLLFRQAVDLDDEGVPSYGVGWEYYLDRLVAVHDDEPFASWDAYYPAQMDDWRDKIRRARETAATG